MINVFHNQRLNVELSMTIICVDSLGHRDPLQFCEGIKFNSIIGMMYHRKHAQHFRSAYEP